MLKTLRLFTLTFLPLAIIVFVMIEGLQLSAQFINSASDAEMFEGIVLIAATVVFGVTLLIQLVSISTRHLSKGHD